MLPHSEGAALLLAGPLGSLVDLLVVPLLGLGLASVASYRLVTSTWLLALQSLLLAAVVFAIGLATGAWHVYAAGVLTLVVKVVIGPGVLLKALRGVRQRRELDPLLSRRSALLLATGLILVAYRAAGELRLPDAVASHHALPVSLALMLLGLFLMLSRRKALFQVVGLITMENGVYLAALVATHGLPLAVELAVFVDLLLGVVLMGVFVSRISESFESIDTDHLRTLRG